MWVHSEEEESLDDLMMRLIANKSIGKVVKGELEVDLEGHDLRDLKLKYSKYLKGV